MWACECCGTVTAEPDSKSFCYEDYYGVGSLFQDRHYGSYAICPECGSEEIEEIYCDEECSECEYRNTCEEDINV